MDQQIQQSNLKYKTSVRAMRKALRQWRNSIIESNPQCYVSGIQDQLEVHHSGLSFNQIFRQAHKNLNIQYHKYIFEYTYDESKALKAEIIRLHDMVDPVVLTHNIHLSIHQTYGEQVTREQIDLYKENYHVYTKK